jgi:two-component system, cell cycle response regulator
MLTDELRIRSETSDTMGIVPKPAVVQNDRPGHILLVDAKTSSAQRVSGYLSAKHSVQHISDATSAVDVASNAAQPYELIVISLDEEQFDGLRLCSLLRSCEATRQTPILILVDPDEQQRLLRALDMGVNDYLTRPIDKQELLARVATQIRRWRYAAELRSTVKASIELAITDSLTGLYNRRYLESHLGHLIEHYINRGKDLTILAIDVDFFKPINDSHGHDAGDKVLQELAVRIRQSTRSIDLCCRTGGEEFVLVLPNTDIEAADSIAERLRKSVASKSFQIAPQQMVPVTISIGLAGLGDTNDTLEKLLKRADSALYRAKREGRNRVVQAAA